MVVVERDGAVATCSHDIQGTLAETVVRARMLAEVIAAHALDWPMPHIRVINRLGWQSGKDRRPMWAAAVMLAVSKADVVQAANNPGSIEDIADDRGVPTWLIGDRMLQEQMYGYREGDAVAAAAAIVSAGDRFLTWLASASRPGQTRTAV
jgi:hypothetical protein